MEPVENKVEDKNELWITRDIKQNPTNDEIRVAAYYMWQKTNSDATSNWYEARLQLLASLVWGNQWLRMMIYKHISRRDLILTFMKINKKHDREICELLCWSAKRSWQESTQGRWGEVQIVINQSKGELIMTPKKTFHLMDMFDD